MGRGAGPTIMIERVEEPDPARTGILSIVRVVSRRMAKCEYCGVRQIGGSGSDGLIVK